MVSQYPHTLVITSLNTDPVQDSQGNWVQQDSETTLLLPCRAIYQGNRWIAAQDGTQVNYTWKVPMPLKNPDIPAGAQVTIKDINQQSAGYTGIDSEALEITITSDMAGSNTVSVPSLRGKAFRLERRGVGTYKRSEFTYLPGGGFALDDSIYPPQTDELFFVYVTGNHVSADIDSARVVASGTVKQFVRSQLNCRIWL